MNSVTWGLFNISPKYPFSFIKQGIKDFFIMLKRICFVIKHGYPEPALWESYLFFLDSWEEILGNYRHNRNGTPVVIEDFSKWNNELEKENVRLYDEILDSMLADLATMRLDPLDGDSREEIAKISEEREAAKNRFFENFSRLFYDLWD